MVEQQQKLVLSPYMEIYELVVPKDNLLRQIKELVDFGFIYEELIDKYWDAAMRSRLSGCSNTCS